MTNSTHIKRKYEELFFPKVHRTIRGKFKETISIVKSSGVNAAISALNKDLVNPELTAAINQLYATVGLRFANMTQKDLKISERGRKQEAVFFATDIIMEQKAFGFAKLWVEWILNYLRKHLIENITFEVNKTTRDHLLKVLNQSITEGMGLDETVAILEKDKFSETQAARIVRTEVNVSANAGVLAAGETYEYQMQKEWVAVHDFRTRGNNPEDHASHVGLDGTVIDFEDVFTDPRNGDKLKSPGDPKAKGESIINCRCQLTLKAKRDERGRLIPKRILTTA